MLSVVVEMGVCGTPPGVARLGLRAFSRLVVKRLGGWTACCLRKAVEEVGFRKLEGDCV